MRLLILGGTGDARALAARLCEDARYSVIVSLAGVVARPEVYGAETRVGGFGGIDGLSVYLAESEIDAVVDATHPFAAMMSENAAVACRRTGVALLRLDRLPWAPEAGDDWHEVADLCGAASALPLAARPFLAIGRKEIGVFAPRGDLDCLMRMIDPPAPDQPLPPGRLVLGRPPSDPEMECAAFRDHGVTHVVTKNSGGPWGYAKLEAARRLGLPVIMVRRPPGPGGETALDVTEVLTWLERRIGED
ncbi:cobalt-precorrin-6A reductase [Stappia sp. ES.058]|uniref:cobalt-precorrin-6A reductase n=1 Tax=Stappia sp. ES.058 TaxID=1881061 RepID=UPI00087A6663|nr:cobalt-precorrin-6A reductase [Stappia sp. ES.058]SDU48761.1 precorrin-6A reductase [Stappia sp. ES.058]